MSPAGGQTAFEGVSVDVPEDGPSLEAGAAVSDGARRTARGAAINYGAQLSSVVLQFGYAAATSRLLAPTAFGEYGAALAIAGFVVVVAVAGLPQAVARLEVLERGRTAALLGYALLVGFAASAFLVLTGPVWAALFGVPGAAAVLDVLAVNVFFTPVLAVGTGVMLRTGRFGPLAITTVVTNVLGMAVGIAVILSTHAAAALAVSATTGQALAAIVCVALCRGLLVARPGRAHVLRDALFTARLTGSSVVSYTAANIGKVFVSNSLGASALGHWNRADVITTVPFIQVQTALVQALFPQFRPVPEDPRRPFRIWSDLLGLVAWVTLPAAAALAAVSPVIVPVFFGPRWAEVVILAPVLAAMGGLRTLFFVLVSALEVGDRMRWVWAGHLVALVCAIGGGAAALALHDLLPALWGALVGLVLMHVLHVVLASRAGLLDRGALLRHYRGALLGALGCAGIAFSAARLAVLTGSALLGATLLAVVAIAAVGLAWRFRRRLPPFTIARKYGLLGR